MFGYLRPLEDELKVKEARFYRAVYCGLCRSIKLRLGECARPALSYDAVLPALLWMALSDDVGKAEKRRCLVHPWKKRPVAVHPAIDCAADLSIFLMSAKMEDDVLDEHHCGSRAVQLILRRAVLRAKSHLPKERVQDMENAMLDLLQLETQRCGQLDAAADCSGRLLQAGFLCFPLKDDACLAFLRQVGYQTGRWVYLADCLDDYDKDLTKHRYNPLIDCGMDREGAMELARDACDYAAAKALQALNQLPLKRYRDLLENYYLGGLPEQLSRLPHKESAHG